MEKDKINIGDLGNHIGEPVYVEGIVYEIKDHGGILIVDLYDESGFVKVVVGPDNVYGHKIAQEIKKNFFVGAYGYVKKAPLSSVGDKTEIIEIEVDRLIVFGKKGKKSI